MKARSILLILLCLQLVMACKEFEQPHTNGQFIHVYGSDGDDRGKSIVQNRDSGFAIAGMQNLTGDNEDMLLLVTDKHGELRFMQTYGGAGDDSGEDILLLEDGYLLVGRTIGVSGTQDGWLVRTNFDGVVQWTKEFGGMGMDQLHAAEQLADGSFAVVGTTQNTSFDSISNVLVAHIGVDGSILWQRPPSDSVETYGYGLDIAANGDWLVAGTQHSNSFESKMMLMRLLPNDSVVWEYTSADAFDAHGQMVLSLADGSLALVGYEDLSSRNTEIIVQLLDQNGLELGRHSLGGSEGELLLGKRFFQRSDGTLMMAGVTQSNGEGGYDFYMLGLLGNALIVEETFGGNDQDLATAMIETLDGGYAMVGYSKSFAFSDFHDVMLLKTDARGKLVPQ